MPDKILIHNIGLPVSEVYPYFSEIPMFVSIHPVIYKCEQQDEHCYLLYEHMKILGMRVSFSYQVQLEQLVPGKRVVMYSEIRKGATLELVFDFNDDNGSTQLCESITFRGLFFIKPFFIPFLARVHRRMIANFNRFKAK